MLLAAGVLAILIGLVHSTLGERYILIRLFRQPLPKLFGDDTFTKQTLRFVWHLTTLAWWGFAALLLLLHFDQFSETRLLYVAAAVFGFTGLAAFVGSRGRHLSWLCFGAIAILILLAA